MEGPLSARRRTSLVVAGALLATLPGCADGRVVPVAAGASPTLAPAAPSPSSPEAAPTRSPRPTAAGPTSAAPSPAARPTPAASPSPPPGAAVRGYTVLRVTAGDLPSSWRPGCPVAPRDLRLVRVPYVGFDGTRRRGELVVHRDVAVDVGRTFVRLAQQGFRIRRMERVDRYGGSDDDSMAADNTSGFNCRPVVGRRGGWSQHAYGRAIDINPRENPYVYDGKVLPPEGQPYVRRTPVRRGMITADGPVVRAFRAIGWGWGGNFRNSKDYQHFSRSGG